MEFNLVEATSDILSVLYFDYLGVFIAEKSDGIYFTINGKTYIKMFGNRRQINELSDSFYSTSDYKSILKFEEGSSVIENAKDMSLVFDVGKNNLRITAQHGNVKCVCSYSNKYLGV